MKELDYHPQCAGAEAGDWNAQFGFLFYCRKHGISVPDTVSVVGFDDLRYAGSELCELTTIRQPYEQMGAVAVELLVDRIQDGCNAPHQQILLEPRLIVRGSSGAV